MHKIHVSSNSGHCNEEEFCPSKYFKLKICFKKKIVMTILMFVLDVSALDLSLFSTMQD